jgi:hypothetical protein
VSWFPCHGLVVFRGFVTVGTREIGLSLAPNHLNFMTLLRPEVLVDYSFELINSVQVEHGLFLILRLGSLSWQDEPREI